MDVFFHRDFTCKIEDRNEALASLSIKFLFNKNTNGDEIYFIDYKDGFEEACFFSRPR